MSDEFSQYAGKHHSDAQYLSFYRMDEIWREINDERSRVSKARDELRRKFM
jgi:hypothetical protein